MTAVSHSLGRYAKHDPPLLSEQPQLAPPTSSRRCRVTPKLAKVELRPPSHICVQGQQQRSVCRVSNKGEDAYAHTAPRRSAPVLAVHSCRGGAAALA